MSPAEAHTKQIDGELAQEKIAMKNQIKLLILGTGESGKSTVMKQLVILHHGGFSSEERRSYVEIIYTSTVQSMAILLQALIQLDFILLPASIEAAHLITVLDTSERGPDKEIENALVTLWKDPAVKRCMEYKQTFQLNDSAEWFFSSAERIMSPSYRPSDDDILRARVRTTGIHEMDFKLGKTVYRICDVGGQRSERRKWLQVFEDVDVLLFLVAISEYDQQLYEDENENRLDEAKTVFSSVVNSRWFAKSTVILFLNKIDLFREKLPKSSLSAFCPTYTGKDLDFEAGCQFMLHEFRSRYLQPKVLYHHFTCATDTNNVSIVIDSLADNVTREMMASSGIL